jgi:hypothetical protein
MRILNIGTKKYTVVNVLDEPGQGNANHEYVIQKSDKAEVVDNVLCSVSFQNGPIKEAGVNGVHNEDLICIVMDRLAGFQQGDYACEANGEAIECLGEALEALLARTNEREQRGVEGIHKK